MVYAMGSRVVSLSQMPPLVIYKEIARFLCRRLSSTSITTSTVIIGPHGHPYRCACRCLGVSSVPSPALLQPTASPLSFLLIKTVLQWRLWRLNSDIGTRERAP